jgi:hypothetical protein
VAAQIPASENGLHEMSLVSKVAKITQANVNRAKRKPQQYMTRRLTCLHYLGNEIDCCLVDNCWLFFNTEQQ